VRSEEGRAAPRRPTTNAAARRLRWWRRGRDRRSSSLLSALSKARSGQVSVGRAFVRRSYRDLVPKRQDLGVLGRVGAGEQHQPAQHANEHQVDESEGHSARSRWLSSGQYYRGRLPGTCCSVTVTGFSARTGHGMAESDQLALDASVAPAGILAGHPQHQGPDRRCGAWSARRSAGIGPVVGDELSVQTQQGSGVGAENLVTSCDSTYSCRRPPSRSRRSGRSAALDGGGVAPVGGC